jgi:2-dehydropantoate 2-reductase
MRHAVLGAGGVGGFVGALLAEAGHEVTMLLRREALAGYPDRVLLESPYGRFEPRVVCAVTLDGDADVLWATVKATQLEGSLEAVPLAERAGAVVPLLNGVEHVPRLRAWAGEERVVPATIAIECERVAPGHFVHRSPFAVFTWTASGEERLAEVGRALARFGCRCDVMADETTLLWRKLVTLGPLALCTTAADRPAGGLFGDPEWNATLERAVGEACAVAAAEGAVVDASGSFARLLGMPAALRTSMQKDVEAGTPPELDAIGGAILRAGARRGVPTPTTAALVQAIRQRVAAG